MALRQPSYLLLGPLLCFQLVRGVLFEGCNSPLSTPTFADLNGDGRSDIVCGNSGDSHRQYTSLGNGIFVPTQTIADTWCGLSNLATHWIDLTGDGLIDVACTKVGAGAAMSFARNTVGGYAPPFNLVGWCDGNPARLYFETVTPGPKRQMVCRQNSGEIFVAEFADQLQGQNTVQWHVGWCINNADLVFGYLNSDSLADAICHYPTAGHIYVRLTGTALNAYTDLGLILENWCVGSVALSAADINGDGISDLLCHHAGTGLVEAVIYLSPDLMDVVPVLLTDWCIGEQAEWTDVDGDHKADAVCIHADSRITIRRSLGNGSFNEEFEPSSVGGGDGIPEPTENRTRARADSAAVNTVLAVNRDSQRRRTVSIKPPLQIVCSALWNSGAQSVKASSGPAVLVVYYNHSSQRGFYDALSPDSVQSVLVQSPIGIATNDLSQELPGLQGLCSSQETCVAQCSMTTWPPRLTAFSTAAKRAIVWYQHDNDTFTLETDRAYDAQDGLFGFFVYNESLLCALISEDVNTGTLLVKDVVTGQEKWSFLPSGRRPLIGAYVVRTGRTRFGMVRLIIAWRRLFALDSPLEVFLCTIDSNGLVTSQRISPRAWPGWIHHEESSAFVPFVLGIEDDAGDVATVRSASESVVSAAYSLHWLVSDSVERRCCSDEHIDQVIDVSFVGGPEAAGLENRSIAVLFQSSSGLVKRWTLSDENDIVQYKVSHGKVLDVMGDSDMRSLQGALLVIGTNNVEAFDATAIPLVDRVHVEVIYTNLLMLAVLLLLVYCILFPSKRRKRELSTILEREDDVVEQASDESKKDGFRENEASSDRFSLSCWATLMACIGMQSSPSKFTVYDIPDYDQRVFPLCPACIRPKRNVTCFRTHCILVLYLCFVAFTFSPNILGRFVGPAASTTKGKVCEGREQKLSEIQTQILAESNYSAGEVQVSELQNIALGMRLDIDNANSANPDDPPFPNFPFNASGVCGDATQAKIDKLYRQIEDDSCKFETEIIQVLRDITVRDYFFWIEVDPVVRRIELPPLGQASRQCPIDASLLDDIEELKRLMTKNFQPKEREFVDPGTEFEQATSELLKTLMFQANMAADVYIFYVCLCLLVRPPLRLSRSKLTVRIKRTWFHWQQIPFVFYFTLAAYFIPIIWRLLNLEELFRLLKNASVDLCFVQPSFIADISKSVFRACNDIEELRELFSTEIETIKRLSQDASAYFLCTSASASIEVLLNNLAKEANATAGAVFAASACGSLRFDALVGKYSSPEIPDEDTTLKFVLAVLTLTQIFGKFILVSFGLSVTKFVDPLSFHDGKIEVIETSDTLKLPHADEVASFLRSANSLPFAFHIFLTAVFVLNMTIVLDVQVSATTELSYILFCLAAFILSAVALVGSCKLYQAEINEAIEKNERGMKVRSACIKIASRTNMRSKMRRCKSWVRAKYNELRQPPESGSGEAY